MIFFRASSVSNAIDIIKAMCTLNLHNINKRLLANLKSHLGIDFFDLIVLVITTISKKRKCKRKIIRTKHCI